MPPQSSDPKINTLLHKIASERRNLEGAKAIIRTVEASSRNEQVIQQAQNEIRAANESIQFLEAELSRLRLTDGSGAGSSDPVRQPTTTMTHDRRASPPSPPPPPPPKPKPYSQLDLLRYGTPLTGPKIARMLKQLKFKLQVEEQYKLGIEKMIHAYGNDRRLRAEAEAKRLESDAKIQLLSAAKKRYEGLEFAAVDDDPDFFILDNKRKEALRKPIQGQLIISVLSATDLNHRVARRSSKLHTESVVAVKIEGVERGVSSGSRNDRWNEDFELPVERANEVEITIYDSIGPSEHVPIGILWLRVSDLMEAQRRQKTAAEAAGPGWVTADKAASLGRAGGAADSTSLHQPQGNQTLAPQGGAPGGLGRSEAIDGWFAVEPAGALHLKLDFVKDTVAGGGRRPYEALGRQGAVRKRKGDVHEMNGHKFVQRQFYQPIMCALCQEFLLTGEGYQCEDCRYACHKKCYPKVVTKCISKTNADGEDEEKINHRIPHRFQPFTNMSANWCCHCGYMLPFGRTKAVKCTECGVNCHQSCSHLVPNFCGMTMEMANELLSKLQSIKSMQGAKKDQAMSSSSRLPLPSTQPPIQVTPPPTQQQQQQTAPSTPRPSYTPPDRVKPSPSPSQQSYNNYRPPVQQQGQQQQPPPQPRPLPSPSGSHRLSYDGRSSALEQGPLSTPSQQPPRIPSPQPYSQTQPQASPQKPMSGYRPPIPAPLPTVSMPSAHPSRPEPDRRQQQQMIPAPMSPAKTVQRKRKIGLDDFNFLAVLGKGNFGKVMLAEERMTSNLYAIKVLKKEFIIENDEVESTQSEKRVFLAAAEERHPFLLGLHSCFQTETRVYFVMDYISGGDLMLHIQRKQFTLRQAKFYACEVLLALQYFHSKGIIYRDLKLDNILLTLDGHVKVADYGLCKEDMWHGRTTTTFCGTPEFMAPEILQEQPYGRAVDWWAFGVLTYEMLLGQSPFRGDDEDEIFDAIIEDEPLYPITMPRDAVSLLQRLLTRDPMRRLGAGESDAEEIKRHQFFADVNFDDVYHKRIPPPYFPTIGNATDTSNFDQEFTREQPTLTPVHTQLTAKDQAEFAGFSWIAPWATAP
ncbi:hypothetical protein CC85DRAFT_73077 [Cutaneotrichosporon oleaginosum]|uniref:protein kinase C n=1 Tax=Cutaneotrichosporon oleaginosum TaxID=879819 RepID=A0A0J0XPF3_9TREE|nr:uncharacterized protein CC85DRAFT_73077 [Cutaneotrichosporon oleaginosum]KLT42947.1 hypothetical protein CC85DRAFT_73077 [Cutaneotrichosporon oleaginosum]